MVSLLSTVPPDLDNAPSLKLPAGEVAFWLGDMPRAISVLSSLKDLPLLRVALILGQAYERQGDLPRPASSTDESSSRGSTEWTSPCSDRPRQRGWLHYRLNRL